MFYSTEISAKALARQCEEWTRRELIDGIAFFAVAAQGDSYFLRHIAVLQEEIELREK